MPISDFSRAMLAKYHAKDPALTRVKQRVDELQSVIKEARRKGYKDDFVRDLKKVGMDAVTTEYESHRTQRLIKLKEATRKIEEEYRNQMELSDSARKNIERQAMKFGSMSVVELEKQVNEYILQANVMTPWEITTLSQELVKRQHPDLDSFRRIVHSRGDDQPPRKLAPELFRELDELSDTKFGEVLIVIDGQQGQRVAQRHEIKDLFQEST